MIDKIEPNQPLVESGISSKQSNTNNAVPDNNMDASVHVDYASLINMAMRLPQSDPKHIEKAREVLLSGQLDNTENIYEAAENIAKYGI
jgi:hypothetical protein